MGRRDGPERSSPGTREKILEVAEELIARDGFEGFQLKEIAARLGIRSPSIFAHFKGRKEIAEAVAREVLEQFAALPPLRGEGDPEQVLRSWARNLVAYLVDHPAHLRILLQELARAGRSGEFEKAPDITRLIGAEVASVLQRGLRSGRFRRIRPAAFQAQLLGGVLANLAWVRPDQRGRPTRSVPLSRLQREAEQLAIGMVSRDPVAPGESDR